MLDVEFFKEKDKLDNIFENMNESLYEIYMKNFLKTIDIWDLDYGTLFYAIDIFKRYIDIDISMEKNKLSRTCIYIASKFNDVYCLNSDYCCYHYKDIITAEKDILIKLNFDIYKPNTYTYYYHIQNKLNYKNKFTDKLSLCILVYFSTDLNIIKYSELVFAISVIQISYILVEYNTDIYSEIKQLKYNIKEVEECIKYIKNKFGLLRTYIIDNRSFRIKYLFILQFINKWAIL